MDDLLPALVEGGALEEATSLALANLYGFLSGFVHPSTPAFASTGDWPNDGDALRRHASADVCRAAALAVVSLELDTLADSHKSQSAPDNRWLGGLVQPTADLDVSYLGTEPDPISAVVARHRSNRCDEPTLRRLMG